MSTGRDRLTNPRSRVPSVSLRPVGDGPETPIRARGRKAPVLVLLHDLACPDCGRYVQALAEQAPALEEWDGHVVVVTPDTRWPDGAVIDAGRPPFPVLSDPDGRIAAAVSLQPPATVVADQWGAVHEAREAGAEHRFPTPAELLASVRYLAVQCPECEGEAL